MPEWPCFANAAPGKLIGKREHNARMAELVDAHDSKSCSFGSESSILSSGTSMKYFFDLIITIGIIGTALPAGILLYHSIRDPHSWEHTHKRATYIIAGVLFFCTTLLLYGSFIEPHILITQTETIDIEGIDTPIRIVLLADFQAGSYKQTKHIERVVARTISLAPDLVLIAGDHVDNVTMDEDETVYLAPLRALVDAGIPTYAVHGNHEYGIGGGKGMTDPNYRVGDVSPRVKQYMEDLGISYLVNDLTTISIHNQDIAIFGGDSYWAGNLSFEALANKDASLPTIGLFHNPAAAWIAAKEDIDLMLFGHTHGGQIRFPFIGPLGRVDHVIPADWYQGLHDVDADTQLYVTSGAGETGTRARLFNPPEVVLITVE